MDAKIKVWIVTGDKASTAKFIGHSSGILSVNRDIVEIKITHKEPAQIEEQLV